MGVKIHFLNVGAGDCTIIHFPERTVKGSGKTKSERIMMIDINQCEDYTNVFKYYKKHFRDATGYVKPIFRFVCSHPHKDHITGIHELFEESGITIYNFWNVKNDFYPEDWIDDPSPEDWEQYEKIKNRQVDGLNVFDLQRESTPRNFWDDTEDRITILSPSTELYECAHTKEDGTKRKGEAVKLNEMPFVLLIKINALRLLFASDAEGKCWTDMLEGCESDLESIDILKAAHHGRLSGFNEDAVKKMSPTYIIFSNSKSKDEDHGAQDEYLEASPKSTIYKTWEYGNIVADCEFDGTITFTNNSDGS